eukprot:COSAG01_NODE_12713_length_1695_cov_6.159148_2_plen_220_part_01
MQAKLPLHVAAALVVAAAVSDVTGPAVCSLLSCQVHTRHTGTSQSTRSREKTDRESSRPPNFAAAAAVHLDSQLLQRQRIQRARVGSLPVRLKEGVELFPGIEQRHAPPTSGVAGSNGRRAGQNGRAGRLCELGERARQLREATAWLTPLGSAPAASQRRLTLPAQIGWPYTRDSSPPPTEGTAAAPLPLPLRSPERPPSPAWPPPPPSMGWGGGGGAGG